MQNISLEAEFKLSFYKEIAYINEVHNVMLVQNIESGDFFVKKFVAKGVGDIYETLQEMNIAGIPKVIEIIDCGERIAVIEEYIHGKNIARLLEEKKIEGQFFSESETCRIISKICDILLPLHSHRPKIIHRDIKPSNLLMDNNGNLYLIDFDAAKVFNPQKERDTVLMGTAEYAAPEQYGFSQSDERTDIYSIGVLMNKMLTGEFPQVKKYGGELGGIIERCIMLNPNDRIQGCDRLRSRIAYYEQRQLRSLNSKMPVGDSKGKLSSKNKRSDIKRTVITVVIMLLFASVGITMDFETADGQAMEGFMLLINRLGATAVLGLVPAYIGNLGKVRDCFPWHKTSGILELFRIALGVTACMFVPLTCVVLIEMML